MAKIGNQVNNKAREEIAYVKGELTGIRGDIKDIKRDLHTVFTNHLPSINKRIDKINWWIAGALLSIILLLITNLLR